MARLDDFLKQLVWFVQPLMEAVDDERSMQAFFGEFGYELDGSTADNAQQQITTALDAPLQALGAAISGGNVDTSVAHGLFGALEEICEAPAFAGVITDSGAFAVELFDHLTRRYLSTQAPLASAALEALGVMVLRDVAAADPDGRDVDYERVEFRWDRLGQFIMDNGAWAHEVYGWGATPAEDSRVFDHGLAIAQLAHVVESTLLGMATRRELSAVEANAFLANASGATVEEVQIPIYQTELDGIGEDGQPVFVNEAGLTVLPSGDLDDPAGLGLALAPYARGNMTGEIPVTERLTLHVDADSAATGGAYLRLSRSGIEVVQGNAVQAAFEFAVGYSHADSKPLLLVGAAEGTRVEIGSVIASVGGDLTGDFFAAAGVTQLHAVIDVSDDGFLGAIVPEPIEIDVGDLVLGWRTGRGVYFDGGTSVAVVVPLDLRLGPIGIHEVGVELDWAQDLAITLSLTAEATLGPLFAYVENAAVVVRIVPAPGNDGLLGRYDLAFGFQAPTGYAVALDGGPISGGGFLSVGEEEYRGALALRLGTVGFSAFAILNTALPGGKEGFSFVASIFGEFALPLGFGFFLTGVGGIIGINRTINTEAMRDVLYEGRFDNLLFPADPIANAATILEDMGAIFPAAEGQHVFGPVARISWGVPPLISGTLGLVLEVGTRFRLLILGGLRSVLPDDHVALVELNLSFFGEIDFAAATISFDASLSNSRVLVYGVSGDIAARTGWAPGVDHVMSFGGLHPGYTRPSNLPDLRRMSINFGTNNPRVTLQAYQAITLNSLQFGASASLYAKGPKVWLLGQVAAEGNIYFDALISFNPFAFDAAIGGSLSVLVDGEVKASLAFELRLRGPNTFQIDGHVWVKVLGFDVRFAISHTWGSPRTLASPTASPAALLTSALTAGKGLEAVTSAQLSSGVTTAPLGPGERQPVNPLGGVRFAQTAVPLGVAVAKVGEAHVAGGPQTFDLAVVGQPLGQVSAAYADFVRGHYWDLTDDERLRTAVFERHKAGLEILSDGGLHVDPSAAIDETLDYEIIIIEAADQHPRKSRIVRGGSLSAAFVDRWVIQGVRSSAAPLLRQRVPADDAITVSPIVRTDLAADYVAVAVAAGAG